MESNEKENSTPHVDETSEEPVESEETTETSETSDTPEESPKLDQTPELEEWKNRYIRLQADFDNYRKRMNRERQQDKEKGIEEVILPLLELNDNLLRALTAAKDSSDFEALLKGIEMIDAQLKGLLDKFGVQRIEALNQPFDPNSHHAVMHVEKDDLPENTVTAELQPGYQREGKVLRPSMVQVSIKSDNSQGGNDSK